MNSRLPCAAMTAKYIYASLAKCNRLICVAIGNVQCCYRNEFILKLPRNYEL